MRCEACLVHAGVYLVSEVDVELAEEGVVVGGVSESSLILVPLSDNPHHRVL